ASEHARVFFEDLRAVIIDEIHALAPTKRGDLLALTMARLRRWAPAHRRIGLSATVAEPEKLAGWLVGGEAAKLSAANTIEGRGHPAGTGQRIRLPAGSRRSSTAPRPPQSIIITTPPGASPIIDVLDSNARIPWAGHTARHAMPELYERIKAARLALVFVN